MSKKKQITCKGKKSTQAEMERRVQDVAAYMLEISTHRSDIVEYFTKLWDVCPATIDKYKSRAVKRIKAKNEVDIELERLAVIKRLDELYIKNMRITDYKNALQVLKERIELFGLKVDKMHITTDDTFELTMNIGKEIKDNEG
jgi:leucyl aminopeptidase (aminopeptidase T)